MGRGARTIELMAAVPQVSRTPGKRILPSGLGAGDQKKYPVRYATMNRGHN